MRPFVSFLLYWTLRFIALNAWLPRSFTLLISRLGSIVLAALPVPALERNLNVISHHLIKRGKTSHKLLQAGGRYQIKQQFYFYMLKNFFDFFRFVVVGRKGLQGLVTNLDDRDKIVEQYRRERGLIGLCMHLGNWELGAPLLTSAGIELSSLVFRQIDPGVERFVQGSRKKSNVKLLHQRNGLRQAVRALQAKEMVTVLCDQDGTRAGHFQEFFGLQVSYPRVFDLFCSKADPVLMPMILLHDGTHYKIRTFDPLESSLVRDNPEVFYEQLRDWHEEMITEYPEQWLLVYDRFKFRHDSMLREQGVYETRRKEYERAWRKPDLA